MGFPEPDMLPGFPAIYCAVHSITGRHIPPDTRFTHTGINNVCVRWCYRNSTHRPGFEISVRYIEPVNSAICSFVNSATGESGVIGMRLIFMTCYSNRAAAAKRADIAILQLLKVSVFVIRI